MHHYYWREDRLLIKVVYISTPWHSVFSWIRSLLSWSKIGVLFIGEKLKTSIPTVRRKYESVPPESLIIISLQSRIWWAQCKFDVLQLLKTRAFSRYDRAIKLDDSWLGKIPRQGYQQIVHSARQWPLILKIYLMNHFESNDPKSVMFGHFWMR